MSAGDFILRNARLLDRRRFAFRFQGGPAAPVLAALTAYANEDGGFGHALEPDLRGPASQPVPLEHALQILDEIGLFDAQIVRAACDWLDSVTTAEGGVPFVLPSVAEGPHAPWWVPTGEASLNPTAGQALGARIKGELVALDPATPGYVKTPLEFAPHPARLARRLFDDATIELHLEALAAKQQDDGAWPITWEPPSEAAINEWRGFMTLKWLDVLDNYDRLGAGTLE